MNAIGAIVLFVIVPVLFMLVVVAAVLGPKWSRAGRWRPGETWHEEPVWLGPGDAESGQVALPSATAVDVAVGELPGPSADLAEDADSTEPGRPGSAELTPATASTWQPGGARGRW